MKLLNLVSRLMLIAGMGSVWAQEATPSVADLEALRSESALLKERLNNLRLRMDVENLGGATAMPTEDNNGGFTGVRVAQVAGVQGHYRATLIWPNGDSITGAAGTKLNSRWTIQSVAIDRVTLKGDRGMVNVPFQGAADLVPAGMAAPAPTPMAVMPVRTH